MTDRLPHPTSLTGAGSVSLGRGFFRAPSASRALGAALLAALAARAPAQQAAAPAPLPLEKLVVSATRTLQDPRNTPSSVTLVALEDLRMAQVGDLRTALGQVPGVALISSGATGGQSSVFMRGASSHQTLLVVDGIRMNDRSAGYQNFLGSADLAGLERVEVLRGPQSTLYGSNAMGGVIRLETTHGCGDPTGALAAEAGSFGTVSGSAAVSGGTARVGYSASVAALQTDNDRAKNTFEQVSASARLEGTLSDAVLVGGTVRWQDSTTEEPGSRLFASPGVVDAENLVATAYGQWTGDAGLASRLTYGRHERDYVFTSAWGASPGANARDILDWQTSWKDDASIELVGGANAEWVENNASGSRSEDEVLAAYLSGQWRASPGVVVTGGLRYDDYDSAGAATTGRGGVAWRPGEGGTKFRATYGTGFGAPSSEDRFGVPAWGQLPSPGLAPEKSRGWDVGIDQDLAALRGTASLTYFRNDYRNLFDYQIVDFTTYAGRIINRSRARTQGAEVALAFRAGDRTHVRASYTYLEAEDKATGRRLARRPRGTADVEVRFDATSAWTLGAGLRGVLDREDGGRDAENFTVVRAFTSYRLAGGVELRARVENLLDEAYEEVVGYAALPLAAYGSVVWRF